jgi:VIT1/CCC1 family predicted Fe2+/Mn2+ transporter
MELETQPEFEKNELAQIYVGRGLSDELAQQVAAQLMARDALGAHARDELDSPRRQRPVLSRRH